MFVGRVELDRGFVLLFPSLLGFHDRGTGASEGHYWRILHQSDKRAEAWSVCRTQVKPVLSHLSPAALRSIYFIRQLSRTCSATRRHTDGGLIDCWGGGEVRLEEIQLLEINEELALETLK